MCILGATKHFQRVFDNGPGLHDKTFCLWDGHIGLKYVKCMQVLAQSGEQP